VRQADCVGICNFCAKIHCSAFYTPFFVPKRRRKIKRSGFLGDKFAEDFHGKFEGCLILGGNSA
jgi:hypothetical protein